MRSMCLTVVALIAVLGRALPEARSDEPGQVRVFIAKTIHTMDAGWPSATAVAVREGKILSVGSLDDVKLSLGNAPMILDETLKDKVLMPGFIEAHGHPLGGAIVMTRPLITYLPVANPYGPDFPGIKTPEEAAAKLKEYVAAEKEPRRLLMVWGWDVVAMGRHLDRQFLDGISVTQPLLVIDASEHFVYANSAGMKAAGLTNAAGKINGVGLDSNGELNGQFFGTTAALYVLAPQMRPFLEPKVAMKTMKFLADLGRKHGITTTSELVMGALDLETEMRLYDMFFNDTNSTMRCITVVDAVSAIRAKKEAAFDFVKGLEGNNTDRLMFRGVKFFADDSFLGLGMQIDNPGYSDGRTGIWIVKPGKAMFEQWKPWWEAGFHIHVHTNGNAGNQATLDALAALQAHKARFDHRFTCQHFGISTAEQARQIKALGGVVSMNPYYLHYRSELNAPLIGAERSYTAASFKTLVDSGVPVSMHSDAPVGPPKPLEWVWIAVNRLGLSGTVRGPAERVTPAQAFRMVTIDAAYTLGIEKLAGSIIPGKFADFTVLEQDPYEVDPLKIKDVKIWGTVLGGHLQPIADIKP